MDDKMLAQLKSSAAIPSMPQVVCRFLEIVRDPVFSYEDLVNVLSTDPGLTGDVLRLANSSFFGMTRGVKGLHQALTLLGIRRIRSLVLGRYMVRSLSGPGGGCPRFNDYWRRSVTTAVLTSKFAAKRMPQMSEEAMIGGLLGDVGVMVLAGGLPGQYTPVVEHYLSDPPEDYAAREREALGIDHAEVGALVLEEWRFPPLIIEAVRRRYTNWTSQVCHSEQRSLGQFLNGAGLISWLVSAKPDRTAIIRTCMEATEQVGVNLAFLLEVLEEAEVDAQELAALLQLQVMSTSGHETVCQELGTYLATHPETQPSALS